MRIKLMVWLIVAAWFTAIGPARVKAQSSSSTRSDAGTPPKMDPATLVGVEAISPRGHSYKAVVPDTLDLADRAELSINALIGDVNPKRFYGVYQSFKFNASPPHVEGGEDGLYGLVLEPRNARTLPMLRAMNGSTFGLDVESGMMREWLSEVQNDGQMLYPKNSQNIAGMCYPPRMAMLAFAAYNWYERDQNPEWLKWISLLANGLKKDAIHVDDRAYFPIQSAIDSHGKWHDMADSEKSPTPYHSPDEPSQDQQGVEGTAKNDQTRALSVLVLDHRLNGNKESLELARQLAREILRPALWVHDEGEGYPGSEHAIWEGHVHATVHTLFGLLDLADVDNDQSLREFVREGYMHSIRNGVARMGWFPAWIHPVKFGRPAWLAESDEICGVADMVLLATRLSDEGIGDYWDDVDSIVRNQLSTQQIIDLDLMRKAAGDSSHDKELNKFRGGFGLGGPTNIGENGQTAACCTGNGSQGLYYAWESITRFHDHIATVNLFLNRASAWMDVDSYLPYEGKVVLHNKQAETAMVRIPAWLAGQKILLNVNGRPTSAPKVGTYLLVTNLKPKDTITLTFTVPQTTEKYTIAGTTYTTKFRGSTLIDISPRASGPHSYPLYQRGSLAATKAPMKTKDRYVTDRLIPLGVY